MYNKAIISIDKLKNNIDIIKENNKDIMAIVKADAYGHGSIVLSTAIEEFINMFGVASFNEAITLRKNGIKKDILVLGITHKDFWKESINNNISLTIASVELLNDIENLAKEMGIRAKIHLKIDTGMNRIGFNVEKFLKLIPNLCLYKNIDICGVYSHYSMADEDFKYTNSQYIKFNRVLDELEKNNIYVKYKHISNSAGTLLNFEQKTNLVRPGIILYGLSPSKDFKFDKRFLEVFSLYSFITFIKDIDIGEKIGYGGSFVSNKKMKIATVAMGYGDGLPRDYYKDGFVIINNNYCKIVGKICMDMFMVDVTNVNVNVFDEVIIIGKSFDKEISLREMSDKSGKFHYELICGFSKRIPREYIKNNKLYKTLDYNYGELNLN